MFDSRTGCLRTDQLKGRKIQVQGERQKQTSRRVMRGCFEQISYGHELEVVNKDFNFFLFENKRTTSSNVLIILDVANCAIVEGADGPEETNDHQKAEGQGDGNDRPGVQFNAADGKVGARHQE